MEVLAPKRNIILDATVFSTLMSCARLTDFRFNYDLISVDGKSPSIEKGVLVHTILEHYFKAIIGGAQRIDAIDRGMSAARAQLASGEITNLSSDDESLVFTTMEQYFDHYKNDFWIPLAAEHVRQEVIYEDDECRIMWKAKLDLEVDTNNGIYPVDHKTMSQRRDSPALNNQFMGQSLLMKSRGIIINKIGFQTSLKSNEKFTRPIISYSLESLTEWSQFIVPFWAKQMLAYDEMGYWPPNYTHCENKYGFCQFKEVCEAVPSMREETLRIRFIKGDKWDVYNET